MLRFSNCSPLGICGRMSEALLSGASVFTLQFWGESIISMLNQTCIQWCDMESFRDKTQDLTISYCYSQQIRAEPVCHTPFSSLKVCFGGEVGAVLAWWHERWPGSPRDPILVLALLLLSRPCFKTVTSYSLC